MKSLLGNGMGEWLKWANWKEGTSERERQHKKKWLKGKEKIKAYGG